ncbi:hypothetical protein Ppb6_01400 [Photorhabdus australis subsp. thailandensis]|uniref:Uncharacterized protein n=1 Tax=Photorhabdus australis subsp. thailandensis TaxID=2805096 RepID=A0A1C0U670_9GAMM|nr:hypothetical protein [Photorhabdus australis]OCQ53383.1 hypothetical protein Ppb6_01400 [Photorhabdus australis subsp. thailandensis]
MTYKKYNPSWEGYMGDFLRGRVGINHLKLQHEFFDAIGLEKQLDENTTYIALLSLDEAKNVLEDIDSPKPKSPFMKKVFSVADPISPYAGNIHDAFDFINVVREFKRLGIKATEYVGKNGEKYIKISGYAGVRKIITASRYKASNMKIISMGIGQQGLNSGIVKGMKFSILFSAAYRTVEFIFKDEYKLADFLGNIAVDLAKTAVTAFVSWAIGSLMLATSVAGASVIFVAGVVVGVGFITVYELNVLDTKFKISETIINLIKKEMERKPRIPEANFNQFLHN